MKTWTNMGDLNFFAYGGCLVKPHFSEEERQKDETLRNTYDVFYLNPEFGESGNQNFAGLGVVDLNDEWLNYPEIMECCGYDEYAYSSFQEIYDALGPELLAKEVVEYHGIANFSPVVRKRDELLLYPSATEDYIVTDEELNDWLREIGAEEHCVVLEESKERCLDEIS